MGSFILHHWEIKLCSINKNVGKVVLETSYSRSYAMKREFKVRGKSGQLWACIKHLSITYLLSQRQRVGSVYFNLALTSDNRKKRASTAKTCLHMILCHDIFKISDCLVTTQPIVGGSNFGLMVPVCIQNQAEQVMGSKPISSTHSWLLCQFLPPASCPVWAPALTTFHRELQNDV